MIICIVGPSGVGKTRLSIDLAKKYNAEVINCDATQVYKDLDIGSAKITKEEMQGIKHHLIDIKNPDEEYSVSDYQKDARKIIDNNPKQNFIVCGGTGLYINALFYDYNFSEKDDNTYDDLTNEELYQKALAKDKDMKIHPSNRIRLINFLNNKNISNNKDKSLYPGVIYIGLTMAREKIYEKVDQRVDIMFANGLVDEVKNLYNKYPDSMILKRAIGYKEIIAYLNSEISLEEAKDLIKKNTRHYVKRQYTWFNNQLPVTWFDAEDYDAALSGIISFIESLNSK